MKLPHLIVRLIVPETNSDVRNIELKMEWIFFYALWGLESFVIDRK